MPYKEPEPDDPLELTGVMLAAQDETPLKEMAACFVEEFLRDGWSDEQLRAMFRNPRYRGPYLVWRQKGEAYIEEVIQEVRGHPTPWQPRQRRGRTSTRDVQQEVRRLHRRWSPARGWDHA